MMLWMRYLPTTAGGRHVEASPSRASEPTAETLFGSGENAATARPVSSVCGTDDGERASDVAFDLDERATVFSDPEGPSE